jgi:hypothetical protein
MQALALDLIHVYKFSTGRILFIADSISEPAFNNRPDLVPDVSRTSVIFLFQDNDILQSPLRQLFGR